MWEIYTYGQYPYGSMPNEEVCSSILFPACSYIQFNLFRFHNILVPVVVFIAHPVLVVLFMRLCYIVGIMKHMAVHRLQIY